MLIHLTQKKDIHTHRRTASERIFLLSSVMSIDDSAHWHDRAKEMLARAEQMDECVAKRVLRRLADAYEDFARKAEKQARQLPPSPVDKTSLPAKARQFSPQKDGLVVHVADAYERLARTAKLGAKPFLPKPGSKTPLVPVEIRQFIRRNDRFSAPAARMPSIDIPGFLKQGPRIEET
jgi:hypothetical protein